MTEKVVTKIKQLYRGVFSYRCELQREYAYAYNKRQAWKLMCDRLAKKHQVHPSHVYALFDGSKLNYEIRLEILWKEVED